MTVRLYLDEDSMRNSLKRALQARGVDVVDALDTGLLGHADEEHLEWAGAAGRVLFSFNVGDFYRLHAQYLSAGRPHAGLILARQQQYSIGELTRRLQNLIAARSAEEMQNQVEFLSAWA